MRQLLLLRHAKSSWDDPDLSDHARPLNPRGRQAAASMAREMARLGLAPEIVLVSSARRTLQTLAAFEPWERTPAVFPMDDLYLARAADMLETLQQAQPSARSVMLVGHNPGIHDLAMMLAGAHAATMDKQVQRVANGYPSGALAEFSVATAWSDLRESGARLIRFLLPSDLSEVNA